LAENGETFDLEKGEDKTMKILHLDTNPIATFEDDLETGLEDPGNIWLNRIEAFLETLCV